MKQTTKERLLEVFSVVDIKHIDLISSLVVEVYNEGIEDGQSIQKEAKKNVSKSPKKEE